MSGKSECNYIYMNGLRLPAGSVLVEFDENGRTVTRRLVRRPDGYDSITPEDYARIVGGAGFDRSRVSVKVRTGGGEVSGLTVDLDRLFSSKGRTTPLPDLDSLPKEDVAKLAALSFKGLSYGKNHARQHGRRVRWALENATPEDLKAWLDAADVSTLVEDNYHSFVTNLIYLRREDPAYVEQLVKDNPHLRGRLTLMVTRLTAEADIPVGAFELESFRKMLDAGGTVRSTNENLVETAIVDGMSHAARMQGAPEAAVTLLGQYAEDLVRHAYQLVEMHKRSGIDALVSEGRTHALELLKCLSMLLDYPRAGGHPLSGRPGSEIAPIMAPGSRNPSRPIDAFRSRDRLAAGSLAAGIVDRLPGLLGQIKHYEPFLLVEGNFVRRNGEPRASDEYATLAPVTLVETFQLLSSLLSVPDLGPVSGLVRDKVTDASANSQKNLEKSEESLAAEIASARKVYELLLEESKRRRASYEALKDAANETFSSLNGLRDAAKRSEAELLRREVNDGHHRLTSSAELAQMLNTYGSHTVTARFVAHTGTEVWVKLADHGESDSVFFRHVQDNNGWNSLAQQWSREKVGSVVKLEFQDSNRLRGSDASQVDVLVSFQTTYSSTSESQEDRRKAESVHAQAVRDAVAAEERWNREIEQRDAANNARVEAESAFYAASTRLQELEHALDEVRAALETL